MMECKKALQQGGPSSPLDLDAALEWLRTHGSAKLGAKLDSRSAGQEGMVGLHIGAHGATASVVKVTAETDFASRSDTFAQLLEHLTESAAAAAADSVDAESFAALTANAAALDEAKLAIRENIQIASVLRFTDDGDGDNGDGGIWAGYVHNRSPHSANVGTAVALVKLEPQNGDDSSSLSSPNVEQIQAIGRQLAMHVVAAKPLYLNAASVPAAVIAKEKSLLKDQMEASDQKQPPADKLDMILTGKLNKLFLQVNCLDEQEHMVLPDTIKVGKYLEKEGLLVTDFKLVTVGNDGGTSS
jgi:elongation factor Ts